MSRWKLLGDWATPKGLLRDFFHFWPPQFPLQLKKISRTRGRSEARYPSYQIGGATGA
jgi:hypothetical protein